MLSGTFADNVGVGAVFWQGGWLTNTAFIGNVSTNSPGLYVSGGEVTVVNGLFARNRVTGGSSFEAVINVGTGTLRLLHTTITSPTLAAGAVVVASSGTTVFLTNTIVTSYTTGLYRAGGNIIARNTLFFGNGTNTIGGVSNLNPLSGDPQFVNPALDDYHIASSSPARDAGTPPTPNVPFDFEGQLRPHNGYDIGYDEFLPTYTLTIATGGPGSGVVTPSVGVYTYLYGTVLTFTATPDPGFGFAYWGDACRGFGSCVITMTSAQTVTAFFDRLQCFAEWTGDNTTDFASAGAQAVQAAVDAVAANSLVKIAGYCPGVQAGGGTTQTVWLTKTLTLVGGYTPTNWLQSYPLTQPTTLDAQQAGRVMVADAAVTLQAITVLNGQSTNNGAGLYATAPITLQNMLFLTNTALAPAWGGGAYLAGPATVRQTTFAGNQGHFGAGASFLTTTLVEASRFMGNNTQTDGGGARFFGPTTLVSSTFVSNTAVGYGGGAIFWDVVGLTNTTFVTNTASGGDGGGAYFSGPVAILNSAFNANHAGLYGGGGARFQSLATVTNTTFSGNFAPSVGGGAYFLDATHLAGATFTSNTTNGDGGGAYFNGPATVLGSAFSGNTANGYGGGGARFQSLATVTNTTFSGNFAPSVGGGAYFLGATTITGTTFSTNTSNYGGGGAWFDATASVTETTFSANQAAIVGGGVLFNNAYSGVFANVLFARNWAGEKGAALYAQSAAPLQLLHTTVASPTVPTGAADAIYIATGTLYLTNTLVASHTVGLVNETATVSEWHSLYAGVPTPYLGSVSVNGSLTGTAAFADPSNDNYHLTPNSAAIDAGTPPNPNVAFDFDGEARPANAGYDIGYDELLLTYTLTVGTAGTGSGVVTPTVGVYTYTYGSVVTLTAAANVGSTFTGWSGACSGTGSCVVTMTGNQNVTATFTLNAYPLTVSTAGTGSGVVTPTGVTTYTYGSVVTLTAAANVGSTFTGWSGACSGTGSCVVTMTGNQNVTATFTLNTYTLTVSTAGTGSGVVTPTTGIYTHPYGTIVTLTAAANTGSTFTGWSGACSGTGSCVVTMTGNQNVTATFTLNTYTLTVATAGNGSGVVTPTTGIYTYTYSSVVTLTAAANVGSTFTGWSGACSGTGSCVVTMTGNQNITANFTLNTYTLTVSTAGTGSGVVTPTGVTTYTYGSVVTLTAAPNVGSSFTGWSGACSGTGNCVLTMMSNRSVTATFTLNAPTNYTLTVATAGNGSGVVTPTVGVYTYTAGAIVTLTAAPNVGSVFTGWSGACSGTGSCVVMMTGNLTATATFATNKLYLPFIWK